MRWARLALPVLCWLAAAAQAEPEDPLWTEAKRLKDIAAQAYRHGDYVSALDYLEQAHRLYPSPNLQFDLGLALAKLGRDVEAEEAFQLYLARGKEIPDALHDAARAQLQRIGERLAQIDLSCGEAGAEVLVDGQSRGRTPLAGALRIEPGLRDLKVLKTGFAPFGDRIALAPGEQRKLAIDLHPATEHSPPPLPPAPAAVPALQVVRTPLYRRGALWGGLAGAAAAVVVTIVLAVLLTRGDAIRTLPDITPR